MFYDAVQLGDRSRKRLRLFLAYPCFLREPFMLRPAERAVCPRKEYGGSLEGIAIGGHARADIPPGLRASDHHNTHLRLLQFLFVAIADSKPVRRLFDSAAVISRRMH